jgi:hypothetical protein
LDRKAVLRERGRLAQQRRRARDPESVREYKRNWKIINRDRVLEQQRIWRAKNPKKVRGYKDAAKLRGHERFRDRFELERAAETRRHLQMKASQLRRSIMRDGVIAEHDAWDWGFDGMIDHLAGTERFEFDPAIIDFQYWFAA